MCFLFPSVIVHFMLWQIIVLVLLLIKWQGQKPTTQAHMTNIFNCMFGTCSFACKWLEKRLGNLGK